MLETSDAVNSLPPETLQPLLFPKNGGITDVSSTNPFRGSHSMSFGVLWLDVKVDEISTFLF